MKTITLHMGKTRRLLGSYRFPAVFLLLALPAAAEAAGGGPWENAVDVLMTAFTGPIARGLSLVSIVIGGLMFAFSEGASKRSFAGIIFGCGMAVSAVNFYTWLFQ